MSLPKKKKNNINVYKKKEGKYRVEELMGMSDYKSTYLPKKISIEDIDGSIYDLINDGALKLTIDGNEVPVIFMTNERWGEFSKTWKYLDDDKNVLPPFITLKVMDIQRGTYLEERYTIPQKKRFTYLKVPTFEDGAYGFDIYKIPQPTAIDITYEVRLLTRYKEDVNTFIEMYFNRYTDGQYYININGHYINTSMVDTSPDNKEDVDGEKFYMQIVNLKVKGYLQNPEDFEVTKSINRIFNVTEISNKQVSSNSTKIDEDFEDK